MLKVTLKPKALNIPNVCQRDENKQTKRKIRKIQSDIKHSYIYAMCCF